MDVEFQHLLSGILYVCIVWGLVNLLPVYPLDGGQISREIFLAVDRHTAIQRSLTLSMTVAIAMAVIGVVVTGRFFAALLFGYIAFTNYQTLKAYRDHTPW